MMASSARAATTSHAPPLAPQVPQQQQQQPTNQGTSMQYVGQQQNISQQMSCLYTKQKTQKRKKWHDGRLVLHSMGASLYDAHPPPGSGDPKLDECCLTRAQCDALLRQMETRVETEKFLIQVEGPWTLATSPMTMSKPNALVSQGMKKVITRKFRKPGTFVPKHPMQQQQNQAPANRKRQRQPLQPGELQRRYYGDAMPQQQSALPPAPPTWNQGLQHQGAPQAQGNQMMNGRHAVPSQAMMNQPPPHHQPSSQNQMPQQPSPFQHGQQWQQQQQPPPPPCSSFQQTRPNMPAANGGNGTMQYNTPPTAPPYQSTVQQQVSQPPQNTTTSNLFAGNKFNPNQFYGEDEELSQGEEEDGLGGWNFQHQAPRNPSPKENTSASSHNQANASASLSTGTSQPERESPKPQGASLSQGPPARPETRNNTNEGNDGNSAALSKNELLKLFGGSPMPAPADAKVAAEPAGPSNDGAQQDSFVLPPPAASDSSSDEESDDDGTN